MSEVIEYSYPLPLETKAIGDGWQVEGYIATFGNVDLGGDLIIPGAFTESLKSGRKVRFLFDHKAPLGATKSLREDSKGLFGKFKISKTQLGEEIHQLLNDGAIDSFSFGYLVKDHEYKGQVRILKQIDLFEASLISIPMNPSAVVTGFKDIEQITGAVTKGGETIMLGNKSLNEIKQQVKNVKINGSPDRVNLYSNWLNGSLAELEEVYANLVDLETKNISHDDPTYCGVHARCNQIAHQIDVMCHEAQQI